jgi:putative DNA methylase
MHAQTRITLAPLALKDAPALIETVFPAQKVSFEAQTERKAVAAQTLTGLGSYWKGRKPLILVRAIVLGSLLPPTDDAEADLAVFEMLMAFDDEGLARRALAANAFSATALQELIPISDPERYFGGRGWRRDITDDDKLVLYRRALATLGSYEEKASLCKRPEEVDQDWLYAPVWPVVNRHYAHLGIDAHSFPELVEQLGILRYGHRPRVGDTFSGGGSIPFEAARIGCDAYASDLNPIACMLTWGAFNIVGASAESRGEIEKEYGAVAKAVRKAIDSLGIEKDAKGNQAKAYLYCLETRCPESGWMVPMSPTWVISKNGNVIAQLVPDHANKRFDIRVKSGATAEEMRDATAGTVQDGNLQYQLDGKTFRIPIRTLRGDFRDPQGNTGNRLRQWRKEDFAATPNDVFQERLYAIHWITKDSLEDARPKTYFAAPTDADLERERRVNAIVSENLARWQEAGLVPDMAIEPGDKTDEPIRTRGWTHWHHLFNARQLLLYSELKKHASATLSLSLCQMINTSARLTRWTIGDGPGRSGGTKQVFDNQALNVLFNYGCRASVYLLDALNGRIGGSPIPNGPRFEQRCLPAAEISSNCDIFITDPPYADAVNYHEITEFFIAWLRKNPPKPFDEWVWDSRRALAIKGSDKEFRHGMVAAYKAMAQHMPDNGMQCVMFTHQDTGVWGDLIGIFWAAGLQVVAAWYIATETTSELKKGGYVQGTVILMLKKRPAGERTGFKQRLLPAVRQEVARQIETMMHLNDTVKAHHGEPVFNDSDLQMAGYAAALKVLTAYTHIGGEDVTTFALRPRARGDVTVVDEIVQQAAETASSLLVPEGLAPDTWAKLTGIERFVLRMLDMETTGSTKLDNYQNFAKAFRVEDYSRVMGDMRPNHARLKRVTEFASRDLTESTEIGVTKLGRIIIALQQMLKDTEPQIIVEQIKNEMVDFLEVRPLLVDMLAFIERKSTEPNVRSAAEVLGARLKNLRFGA